MNAEVPPAERWPSPRFARPSDRRGVRPVRGRLADGRDPRIEDVLAEAEAADRPALLRELLALERELRRRRGDLELRAEVEEAPGG